MERGPRENSSDAGSSKKSSSEGIDQLEENMDEIFHPHTLKIKSGEVLRSVGKPGFQWLPSKGRKKSYIKLMESKGEVYKKLKCLNQLQTKSVSTVDDLNVKMKRIILAGSSCKPGKGAGTSAKRSKGMDPEPVRFYVVKEIYAKTQEDEDRFLARELENVRRGSAELTGGDKESFPAEFWSKPPTNFVTIELNNFLDVSLSEPKVYCPLSYPQDFSKTLMPLLIGGCRKEKIGFPIHENMISVEVLCSFKINTSDIRLVIALQRKIDSESTFKLDWSDDQILAIAFVPEEVAVDKSLWEGMLDVASERKRPDKKRSHGFANAESLIVKCGTYRAQASLTSTGSSFSALTVEVWSVEDRDTLVKRHNASMESHFLKLLEPGSALCAGVVEAVATNVKVCCAVEINNCLNTCLEDPFIYMPHGNLKERLVPMIHPLSKDVTMVTDNEKVEAVLSYRLRDTDLRIAIMFHLFRGTGCETTEEPCNNFALGLIPLETPTNGDLMSSLVEPSQWRTRSDSKFSLGQHDELSVEARNIRLKARMIGTDNAILKIILSTF